MLPFSFRAITSTSTKRTDSIRTTISISISTIPSKCSPTSIRTFPRISGRSKRRCATAPRTMPNSAIPGAACRISTTATGRRSERTIRPGRSITASVRRTNSSLRSPMWTFPGSSTDRVIRIGKGSSAISPTRLGCCGRSISSNWPGVMATLPCRPGC